MLDRLFRLNRAPDPVHPVASVAVPARPATAALQVAAMPKYPPVDPGIPTIQADEIVESQRELIKLLTRVVSVAPEQFEARYMAPIRALAHYVHLLPATAHDEFAGPGGLFRMCLEMAVYSTQASDGRIFTPSADVETRHALEPRWKYAAFLAGLTCEIYRPLASCVVADAAGQTWPKFLTPLSHWLGSTGADRYFVQWAGSGRGVVSGAEGSAVIGKILPAEQLTWLDQGSPVIVRDIMAIALGQSRPGDSILGETVQRIREEVLKRDEVTRRGRYGRLTVGAHLEPYVLDAVRHCLESGKWQVHGDNGPIRYGTDGLYLEWPKAGEHVRDHLLSLGLPGVPRSPATLAEILGRAGAVLAQESGQWLWDLVVSEPRVEVPIEKTTALRFREPLAVLGLVQAKPLERPFSEGLVARVSASSPAPAAHVGGVGADVFAALPSVSNIVTPEAATRAATTAVAAPAPATAKPTSAPTASPAATAPVQTGATQAATGNGLAAGAPISHASVLPESVKAFLRGAEAELVGRWIKQFADGRHENVCEHSGRQIAVAKDYIEDLDWDFSKVVAMVERHQWLGRPEGAARSVRVGEIQFADQRKFGFVLTAEAVKQLGFRR